MQTLVLASLRPCSLGLIVALGALAGCQHRARTVCESLERCDAAALTAAVAIAPPDPGLLCNGEPPVGYAAFCEDPELLAIVLRWGTDVNAVGESGMSALAGASLVGHLPQVRMLLEAGASIEQPDKNGYPPLVMAILGEHGEVMRELLRAGADPNAPCGMLGSALLVAMETEDTSFVLALLDAGADPFRTTSRAPSRVISAADYAALRVTPFLEWADDEFQQRRAQTKD